MPKLREDSDNVGTEGTEETDQDSAERLLPDDLLKTLLPKDINAFEQGIAADGARVAALRAVGLQLVEAAERLVCALYRVPPDLTEEVIAHAHARGARRAGDGD